MAGNLNKNAISALEEYGVKTGQKPVVDVVSSYGPPHKPLFTASAKLGDRIICEEVGTSKHEARIRAAEKALSTLNLEDDEKTGPAGDAGESSGDTTDKDEMETYCPVPDKHPVSALMEFAQFLHLPPPDFTLVSQDGPPHMPVFVVKTQVGRRRFRPAKARSMKEAKMRAACVALNQINKEGRLARVFPSVRSGGKDVSDMYAKKPQQKVAAPNPNASPRNAICVLNEYAQRNCQTIRFEPVSKSGPAHKPVFEVRAILGDVAYDSVEAGSMKDAKLQAAQVVLDWLHQQRLYSEPRPVTNGFSSQYNRMPSTLNERITAAALKKVDQLTVNAPLVGRKVVAAIVMTTGDDDGVTVVSVASGNRCLKGDQLRDDGLALHDSHAEVLCRRGFKRYLYKLLQDQSRGLLVRGSTGKLAFRPNVDFHMYVSTAPCGDGALFVHSDKSDYYQKDIPGDKLEPVFTNNRTQGLLRAKQENGEGTIPIEAGFQGQTFDGVKQGQRLRVMSCSDKIASWNVLGLQGSLLSTVFQPIYLKSVILGSLYHHGHLARALVGRLERERNTDTDLPLARQLPHGFRINHPDLGYVPMSDEVRAVEKSRPLCLNWCHGDAQPEITDATTGMTNRSLSSNLAPSQLCKKILFDLYKTRIWRTRQSGVTYGIRKLSVDDYNRAKLAVKQQFEKAGYGTWIAMPREVDRFL